MDEKDSTVVNYLAAAFAAYELGDKEGGMQFLDTAETKFPTARSTISSLRAQLLYKSGQLEQCLAVLEQTKKNSLNDPKLMTLLKDVYVKLEDWSQLEELLPALEKNKIVDKAEARQIHKRVFMENLYRLQAAATAKGEEGLGELRKTWKKAPQPYKEDAKVVKHYVDLLLKLGDQEEAAKAIEYALSKTWNVELVQRYGAQEIGDSARQLLVAENWLKSRPADADLLLSLGRISMRNQLWGKAREYYETSLKISPSAEAYGELGRLLKHLGETEAGESYLKNYDELVGTQLSNLPMPEPDKITH
jgi:HemY protein